MSKFINSLSDKLNYLLLLYVTFLLTFSYILYAGIGECIIYVYNTYNIDSILILALIVIYIKNILTYNNEKNKKITD